MAWPHASRAGPLQAEGPAAQLHHPDLRWVLGASAGTLLPGRDAAVLCQTRGALSVAQESGVAERVAARRALVPWAECIALCNEALNPCLRLSMPQTRVSAWSGCTTACPSSCVPRRRGRRGCSRGTTWGALACAARMLNFDAAPQAQSTCTLC